MASNTFEMPLSQLPMPLISHIAGRLDRYSTTLIKVTHDSNGQEEAFQIGSGTLASINTVHGILTAHHVSALLDGPCSLGLTLISQEHKFIIDINHLQVIPIASSTEECEGPDLSFIRLHYPDIGTIKAYKVFYDLTQQRNRLLTNPPPLDIGIWHVCGVPAERTTREQSKTGYAGTLSFHGQCGAAGVSRQYVSAGYDYLEVGVEYGKDTNPPLTFGGISGGGLWHVLLRKNRDGKLEPSEHILSGMAFCQSDFKENSRSIKCHGPQSIYRNVYEKVEERCS